MQFKLILLLSCVALVSSQHSGHNGVDSIFGDFYILVCGRNMAEALKMGCDFLDIGALYRLYKVNPPNPTEVNSAPSGLVAECCHQPCHVKDFMAYCP